MFYKFPLFGHSLHGFWLVLNDRKGALIGESDVITIYCQPGFIIGAIWDIGSSCLVEDKILISRQSSVRVILGLKEIIIRTIFMDVCKAVKEVSPINKPSMSVNTNQKPDIKSICKTGHSLDLFSSHQNIKEEKAVWLDYSWLSIAE